MPQLEKGGKWVFGWVVVRAGQRIAVPPEAHCEYGFRAGDEIAFTKSSQSSGEFGIGRSDKMPALLKKRVLGQGTMGRWGQVVPPPEIKANAGARLLAVRGSKYALGFLAYGPIYEIALKHSELSTF